MEEMDDNEGMSTGKKVVAGAALGVAVPAAVAVGRKVLGGGGDDDDQDSQGSSGGSQQRSRSRSLQRLQRVPQRLQPFAQRVLRQLRELEPALDGIEGTLGLVEAFGLVVVVWKP